MTVQKLLQLIRTTLQTANQPEADRKAKLLLAFILGCQPSELIKYWQQPLTENNLQLSRQFCDRLIKGEPLHYILGETEFMGLAFKVTPAVLIPRPDSEICAEKAISLLKNQPAPLFIADIGTGSGALALSLLFYLPQAQAWAVDISELALNIARQNAQALNLQERCTFLWGDLCAPLSALNLKLDLIISNPPYVSAAEMAELPPDVQQEPALALAGGADGLDYYRRLAIEAKPLIKPNGWLVLEHGYNQQAEICHILEAAGWRISECLADYGNRPRVVVAQLFLPN